jgi:hypothetical protein
MTGFRTITRAVAMAVTVASVCGFNFASDMAVAASDQSSAVSGDASASAAAAKQAWKAERRKLARKPRPSYKDSPASAGDAGS